MSESGTFFGASQGTIEGCTCVAWSSTIMTDLHTKIEKYRTNAARREERQGRAFTRKQPAGQISKSVSSPDSKNIPLNPSGKSPL
jgi:hypothetical protein